jgi:hypothetical protein
MAHTSEKRWSQVSLNIATVSEQLMEAINNGEEAYQRMQEVYTYAGGTATDLASLLFKEEIEAAGSPFTPTQEQIDKASDAIDAMTAAHQLYQAANNVSVTQADRVTDLRRMI